MMLAGVVLGGSVALAAPLDDLDAYCSSEVGAQTNLYKKGLFSGCKDGYEYGHDDGRGTFPNDTRKADGSFANGAALAPGFLNYRCDSVSRDAKYTATPEPANQNNASIWGVGYDNGCLMYYEKGFVDGDKEVITASDSAFCPASLKKTSGANAGAYTNGCSYGFKNGKVGNPKPPYCTSHLYSPVFEQGCTDGHQAGVAAATPPPPADPPSNALIVPFAGLTSYEVGLDTYINAVYRWSIGLAALLAVFQIVFGGVLYVLAAGSLYSQEEATGKMKNAAIGLLLLLSISLILTVINPSLTLITPSGSAAAPWFTGHMVGSNFVPYVIPGSSLITP